MKNKITKILTIITIIIVGIGIVCWFGTNLLINETSNIALLFSVLGAVALRLLIVGTTIGIITLMWLIYGIVVLWKKIRDGEVKWKDFCIVFVLLLIILLIIRLLFTTKTNNISNYDYNIKYQDDVNIYNIYKINNKIDVYAEEQVECIKTPCPKLKTNYEINFSNDNMKIVNDFIKSFFEYHKYNSIQIFNENLNNEQYNILKSIIYNDETLLNN